MGTRIATRVALVVLGLSLCFAGGAARSDTVATTHAELALLIDGSSSVYWMDFAMARDCHVRVLQDILPTDGSVSVGVWQFADAIVEEFPLTVIDSTAKKNSLLAAIGAMEQLKGQTDLAGAITAATTALVSAGHVNSDGWVQILDASGDGWDSWGVSELDVAADNAVAAGVEQINAILVDSAWGGSNDSFVRGVGSFSITVKPIRDYAYTDEHAYGNYLLGLHRKLATELGLPLPHDVGQPPVVTLPENVFIKGPQVSETSLTATVSDPEGDTVTCFWGWWGAEGIVWQEPVEIQGEGTVTIALTDTSYAGARGVMPFKFFATDRPLPPVDWIVLPDSVLVTIEDSPPVVVVAPGGTFERTEDTRVVVGPLTISDWDGDRYYMTYHTPEYVTPDYPYGWRWPLSALAFDTIQGGAPVTIPAVDVCSATDLDCGVYTFTLWLYDHQWRHTRYSIQVTIVPPDTTPPVVNLSADPTMLWPPNHKMVDVALAVDATDDRDDQLDLTVDVSSDEPPEYDDDGKLLPDHEIVSIDAASGVVRMWLRSERSGKGDGRTYTIDVTATDDAGNASTATVTVVCPHDMKKK